MADIFNGGYKETAKRSQYGDFTFGKAKEGDYTPMSVQSCASEDLCDGCYNEKLAKKKRKQQEANKEKEMQNYQKHIEDLKRKQEKEKKFNQALKEDFKKFHPKPVKKSKGKIEPDIEENRFATEYVPNPKLLSYASVIKEEAKKPRGIKKKRPESTEKMATGLLLSPENSERKKLQYIQQKEDLELQIKEKELKKRKEKKIKENDNPVMGQEIFKRQKNIEENKKKRKREIKSDYLNYLKNKEEENLKKKEEKAKQNEEELERIRESQKHLDEEKRIEQEKKRALGNLLASQIQEKSAKKPEKLEGDFVDYAAKSEELVPRPKFDPIKLKQDNDRLLELKRTQRRVEKERERQADLQFLNHEKELEAERAKEESAKKEQLKRYMEESMKDTELKKANSKAQDKKELVYYEELNKEVINQIKEEKEKQKELAKSYAKSLDEQKKLNDEYKNKQRLDELENEKALKGLALYSYENAEHENQAKEKYKQEITKQYKDSLLNKNKHDEPGSVSLYDEAMIKEKEMKEEEDEKKKNEMLKKDYEIAQREIEDKKKCLKDTKAAELTKRLKDLEKEKEDLIKAKKREREAQKKLAGDLNIQTEMEKNRKQREKDNERHAAEIARKISDIKEELKKCTKCDKGIKKPKKAF